MNQRIIRSSLYVLLFFSLSSFGEGKILLGKNLDPYSGLDFLVNKESIHVLFQDSQDSLVLASIKKETDHVKKEALSLNPPAREALAVYLISEKMVGYFAENEDNLYVAKKIDGEWKSLFPLKSFLPNIFCKLRELRSYPYYLLPYLKRGHNDAPSSSKLTLINTETGENKEISIPPKAKLTLWAHDAFWLMTYSQSETDDWELKNHYHFEVFAKVMIHLIVKKSFVLDYEKIS